MHAELNTNNLPKAKAFYGELFAWKLEDMPTENGNYTMINVGEGTGGGMMTNPVPDAPSAWLPYVQVDDVLWLMTDLITLGATVMKDVTDVKDMGSFSILVDPTGATIALWQTNSR